jgi:membrane-associated HD superfamily phosphohydrolase
MKKYLLMWLMFFGVMASAVAQDDKADDEKVGGGRLEAMKIAWLTKKLNLSPEEAQKFWPVYNQYTAELQKARKDARANNDDDLKTQQKMLDIRKKYEGEFGKSVSKEKVNTFYRAEREFLAEVQKRIMERRQQNQLNRKKLNKIP